MSALLVVSWVVSDYEGTFSTVIGVASDEAQAMSIKAAYERLVLKDRNENQSVYCTRCHWEKRYHDPESEFYKHALAAWKEQKTNARLRELFECRQFAAPPAITELRDNEGFEVEPFTLDALPTEVS